MRRSQKRCASLATPGTILQCFSGVRPAEASANATINRVEPHSLESARTCGVCAVQGAKQPSAALLRGRLVVRVAVAVAIHAAQPADAHPRKRRRQHRRWGWQRGRWHTVLCSGVASRQRRRDAAAGRLRRAVGRCGCAASAAAGASVPAAAPAHARCICGACAAERRRWQLLLSAAVACAVAGPCRLPAAALQQLNAVDAVRRPQLCRLRFGRQGQR